MLFYTQLSPNRGTVLDLTIHKVHKPRHTAAYMPYTEGAGTGRVDKLDPMATLRSLSSEKVSTMIPKMMLRPMVVMKMKKDTW